MNYLSGVDTTMYDLYDQLALEEFERFHSRRSETMIPYDMTTGKQKQDLGKHKGASLAQQSGMYRGNPVDYDRPSPNPEMIGQPQGFIPPSLPPGYAANFQSSPASAMSPTETAMERMNSQIDRLHTTVRTLKSRLDPVLSPAGPSANDDCAGARIPQHSTLVECIHSQDRCTSNAIDVLDELLARIEL